MGTRFGLPRRNVHPAPPDQPTCQWLRSGAIRLSQRDEGDKSSIPIGIYAIYAYFCGDISIDQAIELIKTHKTMDREELRRLRGLFRGNAAVRPRLAHPKQILLEQAAAASGAKAPPAPPTPHITPIPEGFSPDVPSAPSTSTAPPVSARAKAFKRRAPDSQPTPAQPAHGTEVASSQDDQLRYGAGHQDIPLRRCQCRYCSFNCCRAGQPHSIHRCKRHRNW